jgi:uncharacterized protein (DUF2252 family)
MGTTITEELSIPVKQPVSKIDRYAAGKEMRKKLPRSDHALWKLPEDRFNPVDIIIKSSEGRIEKLIPVRYARMIESPFAFFRGAAAIMAADLSQTPVTGMHLQLCGDCHLMNFGGFVTPEQQLVFDINDFDETLPGPWEWDLKRLATSFTIAGRYRNFSDYACKEAAWHVVDSYRRNMEDYSKMSALQVWHAKIDLGELLQKGSDEEMKRFNKKRLKKASEISVDAKEFAKLTFTTGVHARIKDDPPLIYHPADKEEKKILKRAEEAFQKYIQTLSPDRKVLLKRYNLHDIAIKVVGVGSVGTICGICLLMSATGEPIFLQFKEAKESVLEPWLHKSEYSHHGERVVMGQKMMQSAFDMFLGWTSNDEGKHFYMRQLRNAKIKPVLEVMRTQNLFNYAKACGWGLARAHARTGDASLLSGYIGTSDSLADAIADFSVAYADQNEKDHRQMVLAVRSGRLPVVDEK